MTTAQAKKDLAARLAAASIPFTKLTAKTVSFEGFGMGDAIFVKVHGARLKRGVGLDQVKEGIAKPSEGGYIAKAGDDCTFVD